eukprot:1049575-Prorocentrum_minimum.AAC.14
MRSGRWVVMMDIHRDYFTSASFQVALLSPLVQREVIRLGNGNSRGKPVMLPKQVCSPLTPFDKHCFNAVQMPKASSPRFVASSTITFPSYTRDRSDWG